MSTWRLIAVLLSMALVPGVSSWAECPRRHSAALLAQIQTPELASSASGVDYAATAGQMGGAAQAATLASQQAAEFRRALASSSGAAATRLRDGILLNEDAARILRCLASQGGGSGRSGSLGDGHGAWTPDTSPTAAIGRGLLAFAATRSFDGPATFERPAELAESSRLGAGLSSEVSAASLALLKQRRTQELSADLEALLDESPTADQPGLAVSAGLIGVRHAVTTAAPASRFVSCHKHVSAAVTGFAPSGTTVAATVSIDVSDADNGHGSIGACARVQVNIEWQLAGHRRGVWRSVDAIAIPLQRGTGPHMATVSLPPIDETTTVIGFTVYSASCETCADTRATETRRHCETLLTQTAPALLARSRVLVQKRSAFYDGIDSLRAIRNELLNDTAYARSALVATLTKVRLAADLIGTVVPVPQTAVSRSIELGADIGTAVDELLQGSLEKKQAVVALKYSTVLKGQVASLASTLSTLSTLKDDAESIRQAAELRTQVRDRIESIHRSIASLEAELANTTPEVQGVMQALERIRQQCTK